MAARVHKIKKGLDVPVAGEPVQEVHEGKSVARVALMAADYLGMRPTMLVQVGDTVKRGQTLFEDKKSPGTLYTSPGAGSVVGVNRGDKRALQSVVIALSESERIGEPKPDELVQFENFSGRDIAALNRDDVRALLIESGLWTSFRTRPFGKVPAVDSEPDAIFITAMDTNPLAPSVDVVLEGQEDAFEAGLAAIAKLRERKIYLCSAEGSKATAGPYSGIQLEEFTGPHPAGTVGLHIHTLDPVFREKTAWHLNYQDVIAIGHLFLTGEIQVKRTISLGGPVVSSPRLIRTRVGASIDELVEGEISDEDPRVISGSVLSGRAASGEALGFLGRYHHQISALHEGRERELLGWMGPGAETFSLTNLFASALQRGKKKFAFTTSTKGSPRAMVPIGLYEKVMPFDLMPTFLLRSMVVGDVETTEKLGILELDEEDLALCTFVCPGKYEYGPYLRQILTQIELEG